MIYIQCSVEEETLYNTEDEETVLLAVSLYLTNMIVILGTGSE
jgi:hypothetical protein